MDPPPPSFASCEQNCEEIILQFRFPSDSEPSLESGYTITRTLHADELFKDPVSSEQIVVINYHFKEIDRIMSDFYQLTDTPIKSGYWVYIMYEYENNTIMGIQTITYDKPVGFCMEDDEEGNDEDHANSENGGCSAGSSHNKESCFLVVLMLIIAFIANRVSNKTE